MLSRFIKTAKFVYGWLDWSLLYPIWKTEAGREQLIRLALNYVKAHPEKLKEIQAIISKIMAEAILQGISRNGGKTGGLDDLFGDLDETPPVTPPEVGKVPEGFRPPGLDFGPPTPVEDPPTPGATEDANPSDGLFGSAPRKPQEGPKLRIRSNGGRTMDDLKTRLGLKKT